MNTTSTTPIVVNLDAEGLVAMLAALPTEVLAPLAERLVQIHGPQHEPAQPWLTPAEAAEYLRTTRKAIYNRLDAGLLTRYGTSGRVLLDRREIEAMARGEAVAVGSSRRDTTLTPITRIRSAKRIS